MFLLSIKHESGEEVKLKPGSQAEHDLVASIVSKLEAVGVGWFKSKNKVLAAVAEAIIATFHEAKSQVIP